MDKITLYALLVLLQVSLSFADEPPPTAEQKRLAQLQATLIQQDHGNWSLTRLQGENLGTIKIDGMVSNDDAKRDEIGQGIKRFLRANAAIVGEAGDYDYVVNYVRDKQIDFRQVINGLSMPDSLIYLGDNHEIKLLLLYVSKIDNPIFDRSTWVPTKELHDRTIAVIESRLGGFDPGNVYVKPAYRFIFDLGVKDGNDEDVPEIKLIPVYETIYYAAIQDQISIKMNALTGELYSLGSQEPKGIP